MSAEQLSAVSSQPILAAVLRNFILLAKAPEQLSQICVFRA